MKKMMVMALAILTAVIGQAVGVQWNASGMGEYAGATAYLIKGNTYNTPTGGEQTLVSKGIAASDVAALLAAGNSNLLEAEVKDPNAEDPANAKNVKVAWGNSGTLNASGAVNLSASASGATFDFSGSGKDAIDGYLAIVTEADEKGNYKYLITNAKTITATSNTGSKTFSFGSQANAEWQTYTASGGDDPIIPDVPEPTSMALLALGAAAFGLRRKFSK